LVEWIFLLSVKRYLLPDRMSNVQAFFFYVLVRQQSYEIGNRFSNYA